MSNIEFVGGPQDGRVIQAREDVKHVTVPISDLRANFTDAQNPESEIKTGKYISTVATTAEGNRVFLWEGVKS